MAAISALDGVIMHEMTSPTHPDGGSALVEQMVDMVGWLCLSSGLSTDQVSATAIGGPGAPDEEGTLFLAPNLGHSEGYNVATALERRLGHGVVLENDVNAAAMGELRRGYGRSSSSFAFIAVGTGIGMGVVINRSLVRGSRGAAGEIGFLPFGADPLDATNHLRGPLEEATSGAHMVADYFQRCGMLVTSLEVFARAMVGDAQASAVVDEEARNIARAIVAVSAVLDPEMFVLGGGIGSRLELLSPIRRWISRFGHDDVVVQTSQLGERAAVVGALEIAIQTARAASRRENTA